ncbi:zinc finger CCHC domain-containing protein 14 isoform X2 [Phacochoerus africanus]|uniref:zinc finger CCHC domain-containing protein 14 isoform X2 n=1 Tax=Phacochoerus africanus TaxID=41426 RepID=UPI001FDA7868|nr:zinc finger CCHC domain-containing protein 14 isoform X2 [Phacochoerus africanus]
MVEKRCPLQRDGVYRWFSELPSPQRVEFLCGLLDLCIPLELRFLGSCLEDLARKDYHSLRDSEIKANNPADLGSLTNLTDEVVRSKLLVSLALLGSEQREAAGVLYRTLTHIDSIIHNYGLQLNEGRTGDEFLLLFTMASNHPAFSFHQKQVLRQELTQIQSSLSGGGGSGGGGPGGKSALPTCPACHKVTPRTEPPVGSVGNSLESALHTSAHSTEEALPKRPGGKHCRVSVEKIDLKGLSHKKNERHVECSFELSQLYPEDNLEKFIPCLAGPDSFYLERNHVDLEADLRYLAALPSHILKNDHVKKFFSTSSPTQQLQSPSPGTPSLPNVGTVMGISGRPVCGVAGIPSSQSGAQHHMQHPASAAALPHCSHAGAAGSALAYRTPMDSSPTILMPSGLQAPQPQEQNGILDWLRKLRLHKYYPVFKQLTMEKFLSLTEEDLNKFESLTMGAKKKLKTQLELEKEKSEKRCLNPAAPAPVSSSGVARVPPTSHVGPVQAVRGSHAAALRVEVEQPPHQTAREGSSSECSSSSPSPMGVQAREESSDSAEENDRRLEVHSEGADKDKPVTLLNHFTSSSARPTAQVLPVQNEAGSNPSGHHPLPPQMMTASHMAPIRMLSSVHKAERGGADLKLLSSSVHSLLSLEERGKVSAPRSGLKVDKGFGNAMLDVLPTSSPHQPMQVLSGLADSSAMAPAVSFGPRTKVVPASALDRAMKPAQQPGLGAETSTAAPGTSSTVFHVARPPLKLLVSSSVPADSAVPGQTSCSSNVQISVPPAIINPRTALYTANTKAAFSAMSSVPVGPLQGSFCANSNTASSSSHPSTSFANMASVPSCPAPSSSPALSSVPESSFYSGGGGSSPGSVPASAQNHHHHHHHQQQQQPAPQQPAPAPPPGCVVCTSCGCSGSCGSSGLTVSYANYFQHPFSGPSVFPFPFLPFSPVCGSGYVGAQQYGGGAFPVVHSPYGGGVGPEPVLGGQSAFAVPPVQNFMAGAAGVYQAQGLVGSSNGSSHKKSGNLSCYNCGATGHRAQDCKQPSMDFSRQGTFRLKYAPPAESLDSTD